MKSKPAKRLYDQRRYHHYKQEKLKNQPPDPISLLSDIQIAYLTGLVDGEGSITLLKNRICVQLNIHITMTHEPTIKWLSDVLSVKMRKVSRKVLRDNWKPQFSTVLSGRRAAILCERMLPYAITKKSQMLIGVEFGKTLGQSAGPGIPVPPEIIARRLELKEQMHKANDCRKYSHIMSQL